MLLKRWKNNEVLPPDKNHYDVTSGISKLTLHNVTPADGGTYKCVSQAADSQTTWTSCCDVYVFGKNTFAFSTGCICICCIYFHIQINLMNIIIYRASVMTRILFVLFFY